MISALKIVRAALSIGIPTHVLEEAARDLRLLNETIGDAFWAREKTQTNPVEGVHIRLAEFRQNAIKNLLDEEL